MNFIFSTLLFYFIHALSLSASLHAWTLNNNFAGAFKDNRIKVYIDEGTVCTNNQVTVEELEALIAPAVDNFWNKVPTSNLKLKAAGFSPGIANINTGRLCSPTNDTCLQEGEDAGNNDPQEGLIPAVDDIVIACNQNPLNFGGGNVIAVTVPNKFSGKSIAGALILINDNSTVFGNLSRSDKIGVLAHEIGHALGLGHSEDNAALMYYRTVEQRKRLGQDDIDGISFLYPMKGDLFGLSENGLLSSCGTLSFNPQGPPPGGGMGGMLWAMGAMILLYELSLFLKRRKSTKTRSSL